MINALGAAPKNSKPVTVPLNKIDDSVGVNSTSIKKPIINNIPQAKKDTLRPLRRYFCL